MTSTRILGCLVAALVFASPALAQEGEAPTLEALQERIRKLEERLSEAPGEEAPGEEAPGEEAPGEEAPGDEAPADDVSTEDLPVGEDELPPPVLSLELGKSVKVSVGGQVRIRGEVRDPASYAEPALTNNPKASLQFVLQRTRLHLEFDVLKHLRARVEIQDSRRWGETGVNTDAADVHLFQAYVDFYDIFDQPLSFRAGRFQIPTLGEGRMINGLDWHNVTRRVDGLWATYGTKESVIVHGLAWELSDGGTANDNDDAVLAGVYASLRMVKDHEIDMYFFWRHLNNGFTSETNVAGDRDDWSVGARLKGKMGPFSYGGEAIVQAGSQARGDVLSWAGLVQGGFVMKLDDDMKFKVHTELAFARGDQDPTDNNIETFSPIAPFGHKYHGHIDLMGWRNMYGYKIGAAFWPMKWLSVHADGHAFWLANRKDAWYGPGGAIRRDVTGQSGHYVGSELDLYVKAKLLENRVSIWTGYSHFFPGTFVRKTGRSFGMDWAFLSVEVNF